MTRKREMLDLGLYKKIIDENPQLDRLVLMNWGEPLMHPHLVEMISYAHKRSIETHVTTNGTLLTEDLMRALLDSGLTRISFSMDGVGDTYQRIRGFDYAQLEDRIRTVLRLRDTLGSDIQVELSVTIFDETEKDIGTLLDQWSSQVDFIKLRPQEMARAVVKKDSCRELWRTLVILSNGKVTGCSVDYGGTLRLGDVKNGSSHDIFNSKEIRQLRKNHLKGLFDLPCSMCDEYQTDFARPRFNEPDLRRNK
jgi:radical SAM protein with 4Fe4S-binding SPASM domain